VGEAIEIIATPGEKITAAGLPDEIRRRIESLLGTAA
jgi:hypothetical protein